MLLYRVLRCSQAKYRRSKLDDRRSLEHNICASDLGLHKYDDCRIAHVIVVEQRSEVTPGRDGVILPTSSARRTRE